MNPKLIRLRRAPQGYLYDGTFNYLVVLDRWSGRANVYTVLVLNMEDPVIIGRELPLDTVRDLISRYEEKAPEGWLGNRRPILNVLRLLTKEFQRAPLKS